MQFHTLNEALSFNRSEARFVTFINGQEDEKCISFEALYQRALGLLRVLQQHGISKGDHLILFLNDNQQFVDVFWACQFGGIIPVPLAVGISDQHRQKVFNVARQLGGARFLYTDRKNLSRLRSSTSTSSDWPQPGQVLLSDDITDITTPGEMARVEPGDVAFIQFSSGSTGSPKGVVLRHRNLVSNIEGIRECAAMSPEDISLCWMPLTHDMGLIGFHLSPVVNNYSHCIMRTDLFVRRPLYWITAASQKKATMLGSPNFGFKHFLKAFNRRGLEGIDLSRIRLIFNGAEPISVSLCRQFTDAMAGFGLPAKSMFPVYGLAEASLAVSFPEIGAALDVVHAHRNSLSVGADAVLSPQRGPDTVSLVGVGEPITHCSVRISDPQGNAQPEGRVGHIRICGKNVTEQILGDDGSIFDGDWLDTGDLGFVLHKVLYVTGRYKEVLFVHGQNYYPHDIEEVLCETGELELGKVVVAGVSSRQDEMEEVLVFILHKGTLQDFLPLRSRVIAMVSESLAIEVRHVIPVGRIPKTTSGKIQRSALAGEYLDGTYDDILQRLAGELDRADTDEEEGPQSEIVNAILAVCQDALPDRRFSIHDNLLEIGADSLALVEIHSGLDDLYPDALAITDLVEHPSISDLAKFLQSRDSVV
ncbi:MAG: AMP-binding protein [Proteobacteria bacterium]|nr:AMP-binding protein [Pseudomonadota bacterium]